VATGGGQARRRKASAVARERAEAAALPAVPALRRWLRVPRGVALPRWVPDRLGRAVGAELEARRGRALADVTFGIVDLETTGLAADRDRILEVGLVVRRGARVLERYGSFVDVELPIPPWIQALTGIADADVVDAPPESAVLGDVARLVRDLRIDVLVAHNARFDRAFLERAWRLHELEPDLPPFLCSLRLARRWIRAPSHSLGNLVEQLGIAARARHRALGDAEMTSDLWAELLARGRLRGVYTLESLSRAAGAGRTPRRVHTVDLEKPSR